MPGPIKGDERRPIDLGHERQNDFHYRKRKKAAYFMFLVTLCRLL